MIDSIQQLNQIVELLQKPFGQDVLIDILEDKEIYSELQKLNVNIKEVKAAGLRHRQLTEILKFLTRSK